MGTDLSEVFEEHQRALLKIGEDQFEDVSVSLTDLATDYGAEIIFVSTKKPYLTVKKELQNAEVSEDSVHYVDCIIETLTNLEVPKEDDVLYLKRNNALRNISTGISTKAQQTSGDEAVLVIDSMKALLATHTSEEVAQFIRDIQERIDTMEMNLVLFDEGREVEDAIGQEIYDVVDTVIFLRGEEL